MRRIGTLVLLRENERIPTDDEWDEFLQILATARAGIDSLKILIHTDGGGPNPVQRKRLAETIPRGASMPVAVVSDSLKVRFVASTIALFHRQHRAFTTAELPLAYEHLNMTSSERRLAELALEEMKLLLA